MAEKIYTGPKFETVFLDQEIPVSSMLDELKFWCKEFFSKGLTPEYPGGSSGNLSFRAKEGKNMFYITSAGLDSKSDLSDQDFVLVSEVQQEQSKVFVKGCRVPSSESMMHYAIYQARPDVNAVFHGHNQWLLDHAFLNGTEITENECEYGTEALIKSIFPLVERNDFFIIRNHGFVSLGKSMKEAGSKPINEINKLK